MLAACHRARSGRPAVADHHVWIGFPPTAVLRPGRGLPLYVPFTIFIVLSQLTIHLAGVKRRIPPVKRLGEPFCMKSRI